MPLTEPIPVLKFGCGMSAQAGEVIEFAYSEPWPIPEKEALAPDIDEVAPFPIYDDLLCLILFCEDPMVDCTSPFDPGLKF